MLRFLSVDRCSIRLQPFRELQLISILREWDCCFIHRVPLTR